MYKSAQGIIFFLT